VLKAFFQDSVMRILERAHSQPNDYLNIHCNCTNV